MVEIGCPEPGDKTHTAPSLWGGQWVFRDDVGYVNPPGDFTYFKVEGILNQQNTTTYLDAEVAVMVDDAIKSWWVVVARAPYPIAVEPFWDGPIDGDLEMLAPIPVAGLVGGVALWLNSLGPGLRLKGGLDDPEQGCGGPNSIYPDSFGSSAAYPGWWVGYTGGVVYDD